MIKVFVDAHVLLEVFMKRVHFAESSVILKAGEEHRIQLFTSSSIIGFIAYWMIKDLGIRKTKEVLLELLQFVSCIDISHRQLTESLRQDFKDIEDGIQYLTAVEHGMDFFTTLDRKGFKTAKGHSKVVTPKDLAQLIS